VSSAPPRRSSRRSSSEPRPPARKGVPLRLSVSGGALGLEIYEELPLDPFVVEDLAWTLPDLRFPVDLSGGVEVFRHRRGKLSRLALSASFPSLMSHARPRLREVLGRVSGPPQLWPLEGAVGVGVMGELGALAFDLVWAPSASEARWVVANVRGTGGIGVPLAQALRTAETLFGGHAERRGRSLTVHDLGRRLARLLAPSLGARAPNSDGIGIERLDIDADGLRLRLSSEALLPPLTPASLRSIELAQLCETADDALVSGDVERAREHYLAALERAPRHPELAQLIAHIDLAQADRAEAALGMLVDCMPAAEFGWIGAQLLSRVGDTRGARHAVLLAATRELYPPVAAGLWRELSELAPNPAERLDALDRAVASAPALASVRWARFEARAELGDERGALADAESLEAAASGVRARHEALMRAADRLVARGFVRSAGQLFERALRYLPDDAAATFGLARALLGAGRGERAMALLERSIELSEAVGNPLSDALVALARLLVDRCGDHPQAIARVSQVPASSEQKLEALALEGRWRAAIGDLRGASLAFARLREACELSGRGRATDVASWLTEAAQFESHSLGDVAAAERHLASALRLAPRDPRVRKLYRQTAALLAKHER
jgi:tetratricopeptide (TPR) repeat protein